MILSVRFSVHRKRVETLSGANSLLLKNCYGNVSRAKRNTRVLSSQVQQWVRVLVQRLDISTFRVISTLRIISVTPKHWVPYSLVRLG